MNPKPKPRHKEVSLKELSDEGQGCFKRSDELEWNSVRDHGTVKVVPPAEAQRLRMPLQRLLELQQHLRRCSSATCGA